MKTEFVDEVLKIRPKLKGDELRIVLYILGHQGASPSDIIKGTGISKSHVSENCSYLCQMNVLKKYEYTFVGKLRRIKYYINYDYKLSTT